MSKRESTILTGTLRWPKFAMKDEKSKKYQVNIYDMSVEDKEVLVTHGVILKNRDDGHGDYVCPRTLYEIPVVDADKNEFDVHNVGIGNGTTARVRVKFNPGHGFSKEHGTGLYLEKVQIVDLVPYESSDSDFDDKAAVDGL